MTTPTDEDDAHFNKLKPAEAERLAYLLEELGEAQQAIGKILRHGYESRDPTKVVPVTDDNRGGTIGSRNSSPTNREYLEREIADVLRAVDRMMDAADVSEVDINAHRAAPKRNAYMHHQGGEVRP